MSSVRVIIPARYKSSRFPGKPLCDLLGKSLLYRVWRQCCKAFPPSQVYVATEDQRIADHCDKYCMQWIMTPETCATGTDRVYAASKNMIADTIINVQGDEPNVVPEDIRRLAEVHKTHKHDICYGMAPIYDEAKFWSLDIPKVVVDQDGYLLYASRSPIPGSKDGRFHTGQQQVCVCAFAPKHLRWFASNEKTPMERIEDVEILRFLELGFNVRMVPLASTVPVDRPGDIPKAIQKILTRYKTWIFDCDGVLLCSNHLKSKAFYQVAQQFGEENARAFLDYHKEAGGVSRFDKFKHLQMAILGLPDNVNQRNQWMDQYASLCEEELKHCDEVPGVRSVLETLRTRKTFVVSGSEQNQLRRILSKKQFDCFDGIYGSPSSKIEILAKLDIDFPAIYVGDAIYDYEVATKYGLDFMFVSGHSEARQEFFDDKDCYIVKDFTDL